MSHQTANTTDLATRHGFSLKSICWGYRGLFDDMLRQLEADGAIGKERQEVTDAVFGLLKEADQSCYDHILKEFLCALNPSSRWMMELPGIFTDVVDLGRQLAEHKLWYGSTFFRVLGEGGLGRKPAEVRHLIGSCHRLMQEDAELALALVQGYRTLVERLTPAEIDQFIDQAWQIAARSPKAAVTYLSCKSKAAENTIQLLTRECRLVDVAEQLRAMLRALVGYKVEIDNLGVLDSDELIERGSRFVCMYQWCYLPTRIREFPDVRRNRDWFRLMAVVAAGMLGGNSVPRIQGAPGYRHVADLAGDSLVRQNLLAVLESVRVLHGIRRQWPGAERLIDFGVHTEFTEAPPVSEADMLFVELLDRVGHPELQAIIDQSVNVFDTLNALTPELIEQYQSLNRCRMRACSFLPDFWYPAEVSSPDANQLVGDLKQNADDAQRRRDEGDDDDQEMASFGDKQTDGEPNEEDEGPGRAAFVYHEWNQAENDFIDDYCLLHEHTPEGSGQSRLPGINSNEVQRVRRVFENLKPDVYSKVKYLEEGDEIDMDLLYEYMIDQRREPSPKVRFYQRPVIKHRDLAVCILLDTSGSTSGQHGDQKILDLEKQAAAILAEGLDSLGDRFEIGGFSSHGPENCEYTLFKTIDEDWNESAVRRLTQAYPGNSTRIGVALRHAGWRLSHVEARQRLIILITDGKPMDSHYSPDSRYAQHDVRMACEENERQEIHTFGISTEENTLADMEIMFPHQRFAILNDMRQLPRILPRLYVRLTV